MASADQISCRNLGRRSWASAPTGRRASHINHPGQRRTAKRLRQRVRENGWESRQRSPQKGPATPDNPSVSLRLTAPFAQGSLRDGGCGSPRRPCGPPRNDNRLRWTGVRAAVPRAWPPPTKFRPEIWGVGQVVGPCGKPNQPPKPAGAQRSVRARGRKGWAGIGAKTIPKRGDRPATAGAALSEAESAERAAGQIRSLSDDLFVQHGVPGSVAC